MLEPGYYLLDPQAVDARLNTRPNPYRRHFGHVTQAPVAAALVGGHLGRDLYIRNAPGKPLPSAKARAATTHPSPRDLARRHLRTAQPFHERGGQHLAVLPSTRRSPHRYRRAA